MEEDLLKLLEEFLDNHRKIEKALDNMLNITKVQEAVEKAKKEMNK